MAASVAAPATPAVRLPQGWQAYALFLLLPFWWVLGLSHFIWPVLAIAMLLSLLLRIDRIRIPRGFGIWLVFLGWMLASSAEIDTAGRLLGFALRFSIYASATILFLYLYNAGKQIPTTAIVYALAGYWLIVVGGGFLGVFFPNVSFVTPAAHLIPGSLAGNAYVQDMVQARFAEVQGFLGYPLGRPQTFFTYTNGWGSGFALLTPFAFAAIEQTKSRRWRRTFQIALFLSIIPVVVSLNRGAWLSIGVAIIYLIMRLAWQKKMRAVGQVVACAAVAGVLIIVTPLGGLVGQRLAHPQSNAARRALYSETFERVKHSPIVGYGAPRPAESQGYLDSVGTQGQVLYLAFSHGIPALLLFLGWLAYVFLRSARRRTRAQFWCHLVILIALVEAPFYGLMLTLVIIMAAAAVALRENEPPAAEEETTASARARAASREAIAEAA